MKTCWAEYGAVSTKSVADFRIKDIRDIIRVIKIRGCDEMTVKEFDLNIEKILEDWEAYHAIREVIANALDEQLLTDGKDIQIFEDSQKRWHIRDFGRGLNYGHLTQKENDEKLKNPHVIGKFGIGLKDSLATFDRKQVNVLIKSKYSDITLKKSQKHDFENLLTLHAEISPPSDTSFIGTEFILEGVTKKDVEAAKELFLKFSCERVIEDTEYGHVLEKKGQLAKIYINGVKVSEEERFLFSYNITSLTKAIRKALNRERTNVGRTAYSDRVKSILLLCKSKGVAENLVDDLRGYATGEMHDELNWIDVQEHAVKILNSMEKVLFLTAGEMMTATNMVSEAKEGGYKIITIPENLKDKIRGTTDVNGNPIRDLDQFYTEYNESFEFKFVDPNKLSSSEKKIFETTERIFKLIDGKPKVVKEVKISETMRKELGTFMESTGIWEASTGRIIIKRSQLTNLETYAATLLHEVAHAKSGAIDVSRTFEIELTKMLGIISSKAIE